VDNATGFLSLFTIKIQVIHTDVDKDAKKQMKLKLTSTGFQLCPSEQEVLTISYFLEVSLFHFGV